MKSLGINLFVAIIWLFLSERPTLSAFGVGFAVGFLLLAAFRPVVRSDQYVRRVMAFLRFVLVFVREFIRANIKVAWAVLFRPRESLRPNFITYDVAGLTRGEILLLSYCVSLTPGTTTVSISPEFCTLTIHALDADEPDLIRAELDAVLKNGILAFSR